jgi:hypothetical protein
MFISRRALAPVRSWYPPQTGASAVRPINTDLHLKSESCSNIIAKTFLQIQGVEMVLAISFRHLSRNRFHPLGGTDLTEILLTEICRNNNKDESPKRTHTARARTRKRSTTQNGASSHF